MNSSINNDCQINGLNESQFCRVFVVFSITILKKASMARHGLSAFVNLFDFVCDIPEAFGECYNQAVKSSLSFVCKMNTCNDYKIFGFLERGSQKLVNFKVFLICFC